MRRIPKTLSSWLVYSFATDIVSHNSLIPSSENLSGNAGMATAGSGDVLAGIIGSLMAQGLEADTAAPLAVYLHGVAGDEMLKETGKSGLIASDIIEGIRRIMGCKEQKDIIL